MIESMGDVLELGVMVVMVIFGLGILYTVVIQNKKEVMKKREARYYRLYEESDAVFEEDDKNEPYYED